MNFSALRIDIDSKKGLEKGVPVLLDLLNEINIKATFFINMGTLWSIGEILKTFFSSSKKIISTNSKIGLISKFGFFDFFEELIFARQKVGDSNRSMIKRIAENGHEVGLHGGIDHSTWMRRLGHFSEIEIERFIQPAFNSFKACFGYYPIGFSSPGFISSYKVLRVLTKLNFKYVSDNFNDKPKKLIIDGKEILKIPITAGNEIPFIEFYASNKCEDGEIINKILTVAYHKNKNGLPFIWYIHAVYEPIKKFEVLKELLYSINEVFCALTFKQIIDKEW